MSAPHTVSRALAVAPVLAALLAVVVLPAAVPVTVTVAFSASAQAELERYGKDEGAELQARIETAVTRACAGTPEGAAIAVTVEDIAPTHPTRAQLAANPSLDPVRTRSLGGADLTGVLRDGRGQVLATVKHNYYPPTLQLGSASLEPWADAGIAIEQFASQMGKACRRAPAR